MRSKVKAHHLSFCLLRLEETDGQPFPAVGNIIPTPWRHFTKNGVRPDREAEFPTFAKKSAFRRRTTIVAVYGDPRRTRTLNLLIRS